MELKLTVLAGAKKNMAIPLKKKEFTIGRSSGCTLRTGNDAISRRHCSIVRTEEGMMVSDMGSRNGTYLNDNKLQEPALLKEGDELRVGPLVFLVEKHEKKMPLPAESKAAASPGLKKVKQPPVKDVADAAARTAAADDGGELEEDISRWLIGDPNSSAMQETVNLKTDETAALSANTTTTAIDEQELQQAIDDLQENSAESSDSSDTEEEGGTEEAAGDQQKAKGKWSILGSGGKAKEKTKKAAPGKLPKQPEKNKTKDSREAATDILRDMTRRR